MEYYPFDSRNILYRSKLGALAEGETVRLKLLIHNDAHVHRAYLKIKNDKTEVISKVYMQPCKWLEQYRFYECEVTLGEGLYWYQFSYSSDFGDFNVTRSEHSLGIVSDDGDWWQQLVYRRNYKTPDWLDGGIIYQIFPDRFDNSGCPKSDIPKDRFICKEWFKQPEYKQDDDFVKLGNDYYGGDLKGIEKKLDYISSLGVNCIYLNPIFESHSNHRYNTADYFKIDPMLGTEQDLISLIRESSKRGIYIILDGVFSHTGDDSVYFNKYKRYKDEGAYNSTESAYFSWYKFNNYPDDYSCWWGVPSLPETNEDDLSFSNFICGENGVIRYWLKKGIKGWRLDVADELPDIFIDKIRNAVKSEGEDNYLLGEVWEDATNKISYGNRRRFLRGDQLDSVMNYPLSEAIITYIQGGNSRDLMDKILDILENYPPQSIKLLMNHIGTHDTSRIITRLGNKDAYIGNREWQSQRFSEKEEYEHGVKLLKLAAVLQFTLPGIPSIYYGDEAGLEGYGDPFCRAGYPWGKENCELLEFYKKLGQFRKESPVFKSGEFIPVYANFGDIVYIRRRKESCVLIAVNRWKEPSEIEVPEAFNDSESVFGDLPEKGKIKLPAEGFTILKKYRK